MLPICDKKNWHWSTKGSGFIQYCSHSLSWSIKGFPWHNAYYLQITVCFSDWTHIWRTWKLVYSNNEGPFLLLSWVAAVCLLFNICVSKCCSEKTAALKLSNLTGNVDTCWACQCCVLPSAHVEDEFIIPSQQTILSSLGQEATSVHYVHSESQWYLKGLLMKTSALKDIQHMVPACESEGERKMCLCILLGILKVTYSKGIKYKACKLDEAHGSSSCSPHDNWILHVLFFHLCCFCQGSGKKR